MRKTNYKKVYGRLTLLELIPNRKAICLCECGKKVEVFRNNLTSGNTRSCGCLWFEEVAKKHTHNMEKTTEYNSWKMMKDRCLNKKTKIYFYYGGRGITICKEWIEAFEAFIADMGRKPTSQHSLDRIDNNGNYNKENCKWSTRKEQANNRRTRQQVVEDNIKYGLTPTKR